MEHEQDFIQELDAILNRFYGIDDLSLLSGEIVLLLKSNDYEMLFHGLQMIGELSETLLKHAFVSRQLEFYSWN
jgi:hypothetical protein